MSCHLTLVGLTIIKKSTSNKCWGRYGEKGALLHCWWECKLIQSRWRTICRFLKKPGIKQPYDPAIPLQGIYPEEVIIEKDTCTPVFTEALKGWDGVGGGREGTYVYLWQIHVDIWQKLTQYCKVNIFH